MYFSAMRILYSSVTEVGPVADLFLLGVDDELVGAIKSKSRTGLTSCQPGSIGICKQDSVRHVVKHPIYLSLYKSLWDTRTDPARMTMKIINFERSDVTG